MKFWEELVQSDPVQPFLGSDPVGSHNLIYFRSKIACVWKLGHLFDERKGVVFLSRCRLTAKLLLTLASTVILCSKSHGTHGHIFTL
jgi:hypothetical protein